MHLTNSCFELANIPISRWILLSFVEFNEYFVHFHFVSIKKETEKKNMNSTK